MMYGEHTHTILYEILLTYQIKLWHTVLEAQTLCGRLETVWECEGDHTAPKSMSTEEAALAVGGFAASSQGCALFAKVLTWTKEREVGSLILPILWKSGCPSTG